MKLLVRLFSFAIFLPAYSGAAMATAWDVIDLGTLGGSRSSGLDISQTGLVVGLAQDASGEFRAFSFSKRSGMQAVPLPFDSNPSSSSRGIAVNASGEIVGLDGGGAFVVSKGVAERPPDLGMPGSTIGLSINARGDVVGASWTGDGEQRGFLYSRGVMSNLGTLVGHSVATHINNGGRIVGFADNGGNTRAVEFIDSVPVDLGLPAGEGEAWGINENGVIVGRGRTPVGTLRAFRLDGNGLFDLGTPGTTASIAQDINNAGQVVGYFYAPASEPRAFLYDAHRGLVDLSLLPVVQASGWSMLSTATAINGAGWIVGTGSRDGHDRAYLLIPVSEPGTFVLLGLGLAGLGLSLRRKAQTTPET